MKTCALFVILTFFRKEVLFKKPIYVINFNKWFSMKKWSKYALFYPDYCKDQRNAAFIILQYINVPINQYVTRTVNQIHGNLPQEKQIYIYGFKMKYVLIPYQFYMYVFYPTRRCALKQFLHVYVDLFYGFSAIIPTVSTLRVLLVQQ